MSDIEIRPPKSDEMTAIYEMGYPHWNLGRSFKDYVEWNNSSITKNGASWFALYFKGVLVSSMLVHPFSANLFGFGSISTAKEYTKKGFATHLIKWQIIRLRTINEAINIVLYSDIDPKFYESFGFKLVKSEFQKYQKSIVMVMGPEELAYIHGKRLLPEYF